MIINKLSKVTGFSPKLLLGYFGVLIFMMGEGLEQGWLSPFIISRGMSIEESSLLFSVYGFFAAVAAWLSGVLAEIYTARRVMIFGFVMFVIGSVIFLSVGLPSNSLSIMVPTYALRGFGYPMFAYGFLVWVAYEAPIKKLGSAVGIFWFVYSGGLGVLGVMYSSYALPILGEMATLWSGLIFVTIGAFIAIALNRNKAGDVQDKPKEKVSLSYLFKGITIAFENPKIGLGGIVRTINTSAAYGFVIFMPMFLADFGFSRTEWLHIYAALWTVNIAFNLIFGVVSDRIGWRNIVIWFGCVGCMICTLMFYYVPYYFGHSYTLMMIAAGLFGACLAGYVPLSAIMPTLAPENKGAAMSVLNLGAGLSTFVGPALVGIFISSVGALGVIWIFSGLYLFSAILMKFITVPQELLEQSAKMQLTPENK
ncbi:MULTISPECIES: MFS transporter [Providencia]|uniref:MFS transporter n=2 Tax=Providencia TaxID=586 RepID=A0AA42FN00_9GAMM|nr:MULTISPECIES: MFS transporter [Providencia]APC11551.1 Alpha-ketoglutarate permease [Providencia rettgeri]AVL74901.1 MFS transporter [Providencia rettgeri]EIL1983218.1 MFS transporter [Providencia rettgeri]EIU9515877.1 MFS transporter [Providencia rettgeri]EJD6041705.1 MFS transporter [Providencia rettgeri]